MSNEQIIWKKTELFIAVLALFFAGVTAYYAIQATNIASESLKMALESQKIALEAKEFTTRPSYIIVETDSERNFLNDERNEYHMGGSPDIRRDNIIVNVWNVGAQVAENVTISVSFDPHRAILMIFTPL